MTTAEIDRIYATYTAREREIIGANMYFLSRVNAPAPKTKEELKALCDEILSDYAEMKRIEAEQKAKRAEKERAKVEKKGLTVEEFRRLKGKKSAFTRVSREIEELERELKAKKAYLERAKKEIEELES